MGTNLQLKKSDKVSVNIYSPEDIKALFKEKEIDKSWSFSGYKSSDTGKWTHNYHRYPAKFIPQLVEVLIDEYIFSKNAHINDPFMGCGTTIVTAISRGFKASSTDINRIAYLITKVKSIPVEPSLLKRKIENLLIKINSISDRNSTLFSDDIGPLIPQRHLEKINYWFPEDIKIKLGKILRVISEERMDIIRDYFLVAFSNILKNCSIWLQGSTKPTRDLSKIPADPYQALKRQLLKMYRGNEKFYSIVPDEVKKNIHEYLNIKVGDARKQPVENDSVDLIVTSSPYVTSYEYADLHQLSTIWLDLTDNILDYKKQFIGTSYKSYSDKLVKSIIAQEIIFKMQEKNKKLSKEIEAFFLDMEEVIKESFRILKVGGRACYVIGNTKIKGIDILNAEVFAEIMQYSGFILDRIIKREIPSKILPQKRDEKTGRFASNHVADSEAYPVEYIIIGLKE